MSYLKKNKGILFFTIVSIIAVLPYDVYTELDGNLILRILFFLLIILKTLGMIPAIAWALVSPVLLIVKLVEFVKSLKEKNKLSVQEASITILLLVLLWVSIVYSVTMYGIERVFTFPMR